MAWNGTGKGGWHKIIGEIIVGKVYDKNSSGQTVCTCAVVLDSKRERDFLISYINDFILVHILDVLKCRSVYLQCLGMERHLSVDVLF